MARLPKTFWQQVCESTTRKKAVAPYYLSEPFASALAPPEEPSDFFCHIIWRQREDSTKRSKKGKKATPRYVAEPFTSLCCIDKGFGGICATLSGGNPPRYETNHTFFVGQVAWICFFLHIPILHNSRRLFRQALSDRPMERDIHWEDVTR
jgi:hypothetical protein